MKCNEIRNSWKQIKILREIKEKKKERGRNKAECEETKTITRNKDKGMHKIIKRKIKI